MRRNFAIVIGLIRLLKVIVLNFGKLKIKGFKYYIGRGVRLWLYSKGTCNLGEKTWLSDFCTFESNGGFIELGYNNYFNSNCKVISLNKITIGDNNLFAPNVIIVDHKHNYEDWNQLICKQGFSSDPVIIGSNIWICSNVVITQGVTIGDNIVIAANSVVTANLLEPGVYAGSPAKLIKGMRQ